MGKATWGVWRPRSALVAAVLAGLVALTPSVDAAATAESPRLTAGGPAAAAPSPIGGAAGAGRALGTPVRPGVPAQAGDGLDYEHRAHFELDADAVVVRARLELTVTNTAPDRRQGDYIHYTYFPELPVPVPTGAAGVHAVKSDGTVLGVRVEPSESPLVQIAWIDLVPDLRYRSTQQIALTYELPPVPPRSQTIVRVNPAFVSMPIFADGDPGKTSIEVRIPGDFEVEVIGEEMDRSEEAGATVLRASPADPGAWVSSVVARRDDLLISREVDVAGHEVVVSAWPDDAQWADFAEDHVRKGIPVLERLVGLPWPAEDGLVILETAAPYLYGYAGWYRPVDHLIEVGDELDQHVVLHELSHLWFNSELFTGRWINEGMADVFAAAAVRSLGGQPEVPEPIDPSAPGAVALNDWGEPDLESGDSEAREAFGYNASFWVMQQLADEVGLDGLAELLALADAGESAYEGPGFEDRRSHHYDWTDLVDLLEIRLGSTQVVDLFRQHVVGPRDAGWFDERAATRAQYLEHVERSAPWDPPAGVRISMTNWAFANAVSAMQALDELLPYRDDLRERLTAVDADLAGFERAYETARGVADVEAVLEEVEGATAALEEATDAVGAGRDPLAMVGLLMASPERTLDDALRAFAAGDFDAAAARAADAVAQVDGARTAGLIRLAAVVVALLLVWLLVRWRRRRARARPAVPPGDDLAPPAGAGAGAPAPAPADDAAGPGRDEPEEPREPSPVGG